MSDIRFNQWLHNSGTGGVSQVDGGHVGIGTTNPEIAVHSGNNKILNVGIVTASTYYGDGSNLSGIVGGGTSLSFNDNIGAYFGNSQDLKIYHDGNHSYIDDQGTGNLRLRSGTLEILNLAGNKTSAIFSSGGGQTLNFNNSARFTTTNTGAVVTGILTATASLNVKQSGNAYLNLLSTGTGNAGIYMDASNGDIAGSDYCSIYQKNDLDLAITNRKNTANIIFETGGENERLRIDSNGKIGINLTNPGDYNSSANNLVVHSSPSNNDAGITIRSNYAGTGGLYFADGTGTSSDKGYIAYGQSNDTMYFGINRGSKLQINSSGAFGLAGSNYGATRQVMVSNGSGSAVSWSSNPLLLDMDSLGDLDYDGVFLRYRETATVTGNGLIYLGLCKSTTNCPAGRIGIPVGFIPGSVYNSHFRVDKVGITPWPDTSGHRYEFYAIISDYVSSGKLGVFYLTNSTN